MNKILPSLMVIAIGLASLNSIAQNNGCRGNAKSAAISTPIPATNNLKSTVNSKLIAPTSVFINEDFADITTLTSDGWSMQNLSIPLGTTDWFQGNPSVFSAYEGASSGYIGANFNNTTGANTINNWLISPEVPISNGNVLSFWTRKTSGSSWPDRTYIRMSTAGSSTNTADFTVLLEAINSGLTTVGYPTTWTEYVITISGLSTPTTGRFAFNYNVINGGPSGANSDYIGIDLVQFMGFSPTVTLSSTSSNPTKDNPIVTTIQFSQVVSGFDLSDLVIVNGTAKNLVSLQSGAKYTVDIVPTHTGIVTVDIPSNSAFNSGSLGNISAPQFSINYDNTGPSALLTSGSSNPTNDNPVVVSILFTEKINNFLLSNIKVTNGVATNLVQIETLKKYTVDILPTKVGLVTVEIPIGSVSDHLGNKNTTATEFSLTCNNISPTVTVSTSGTNPTNNNPLVTTVLFSEVVTGFELADLDLSNGTAGNLKTIVAGKQFTVDITPAGEGLIIANIPANSVQNTSGNGNAYSSPFSINYDKTAPIAILSTLTESPTNSSSIGITIDFNEVVSGFALTDLTVGNGTASNLVAIVAGLKYTADIAPTTNGAVTIDIAPSAVNDIAGNTNSTAKQLSIISDKAKPLASVSATAGNPTNDYPIAVTIDFNEVVKGFGITDITIGNGSVIKFEEIVGGMKFLINIKPKVEGAVTINIGAGIATDLAGNTNSAATEFSVTYDETAPIASISSLLSNPTNDNTMSINIDFSETVTGFDLADVVVGNGTASNLVATTAGKNYTVDVTPIADGEVTVYLNDNIATDNAGNGNKSALFAITYESTIPTVTIFSAAQSVTNQNPIVLTMNFSEVIVGFELADVTVVNGTARNLSEIVSGKKYTVEIIPTAEGIVTADIASGKVFDLAGNENSAAAQFKTNFDATPPKATISTTATSPTNASSINLNIKFNEAVVGFSIDYVYTGNGKGSNFVEVVPGLEYTLTVSPVTDGDVTLYVAGGIMNDAAGNGNIASSSIVITFDRTAPVLIGIGLKAVTTNTAGFSVSINEECKIYYQVLLEETTAPSAQEILANTGDSVVTAGNMNIQSDVENEISLIDLDTDETYTLYMLTQDELKNHSTVCNIDFVTDFETLQEPVGIVQNDGKNIQLYPNPNNGEFIIDVKDVDILGARITVRNIAGSLIEDFELKESKQKMNLKNQPQGVYVIQVHLNTGINTYKFVIE